MIEIESATYCFITGINEPEDSFLEFELVCGTVSESEEHIFVVNKN